MNFVTKSLFVVCATVATTSQMFGMQRFTLVLKKMRDVAAQGASNVRTAVETPIDIPALHNSGKAFLTQKATDAQTIATATATELKQRAKPLFLSLAVATNPALDATKKLLASTATTVQPIIQPIVNGTKQVATRADAIVSTPIDLDPAVQAVKTVVNKPFELYTTVVNTPINLDPVLNPVITKIESAKKSVEFAKESVAQTLKSAPLMEDRLVMTPEINHQKKTQKKALKNNGSTERARKAIAAARRIRS